VRFAPSAHHARRMIPSAIPSRAAHSRQRAAVIGLIGQQRTLVPQIIAGQYFAVIGLGPVINFVTNPLPLDRHFHLVAEVRTAAAFAMGPLRIGSSAEPRPRFFSASSRAGLLTAASITTRHQSAALMIRLRASSWPVHFADTLRAQPPLN